MKSDTKSTKPYILVIIGLLTLILVLGIAAAAYLLGSSNKPETNGYQQKQEQINSCVQNSPPITDGGSLEENYRKQQDRCAKLYR